MLTEYDHQRLSTILLGIEVDQINDEISQALTALTGGLSTFNQTYLSENSQFMRTNGKFILNEDGSYYLYDGKKIESRKEHNVVRSMCIRLNLLNTCLVVHDHIELINVLLQPDAYSVRNCRDNARSYHPLKKIDDPDFKLPSTEKHRLQKIDYYIQDFVVCLTNTLEQRFGKALALLAEAKQKAETQAERLTVQEAYGDFFNTIFKFPLMAPLVLLPCVRRPLRHYLRGLADNPNLLSDSPLQTTNPVLIEKLTSLANKYSKSTDNDDIKEDELANQLKLLRSAYPYLFKVNFNFDNHRLKNTYLLEESDINAGLFCIENQFLPITQNVAAIIAGKQALAAQSTLQQPSADEMLDVRREEVNRLLGALEEQDQSGFKNMTPITPDTHPCPSNQALVAAMKRVRHHVDPNLDDTQSEAELKTDIQILEAFKYYDHEAQATPATKLEHYLNHIPAAHALGFVPGSAQCDNDIALSKRAKRYFSRVCLLPCGPLNQEDAIRLPKDTPHEQRQAFRNRLALNGRLLRERHKQIIEDSPAPICICPMNYRNTHWLTLVFIKRAGKPITCIVFDSLQPSESKGRIFQHIKQTYRQPGLFEEASFIPADFFGQFNGTDCGIITLQIIEDIIQGEMTNRSVFALSGDTVAIDYDRLSLNYQQHDQTPKQLSQKSKDLRSKWQDRLRQLYYVYKHSYTKGGLAPRIDKNSGYQDSDLSRETYCFVRNYTVLGQMRYNDGKREWSDDDSITHRLESDLYYDCLDQSVQVLETLTAQLDVIEPTNDALDKLTTITLLLPSSASLQHLTDHLVQGDYNQRCQQAANLLNTIKNCSEAAMKKHAETTQAQASNTNGATGNSDVTLFKSSKPKGNSDNPTPSAHTQWLSSLSITDKCNALNTFILDAALNAQMQDNGIPAFIDSISEAVLEHVNIILHDTPDPLPPTFEPEHYVKILKPILDHIETKLEESIDCQGNLSTLCIKPLLKMLFDIETLGNDSTTLDSYRERIAAIESTLTTAPKP